MSNTFLAAIEALQPDADVVILCWDDTNTQLRVTPYWECTYTPKELTILAAVEALLLAETVGHGPIHSQVIDLRATQ